MRGASAGSEPALISDNTRRWRDLRLRLLSALILAPLALLCVWAGGWVFTLAMGILCLLMLHEGQALVRHRDGRWYVGGAVYVILPCLALIWLRSDPVVGRGNLLFLLSVVWASDIGAYLVGRLIGGPKLAPRISPGKTWSGTVGGLVTATLIGAAANSCYGTGIGKGAGLALLLGLAAQLGDLFESWAKRRLGVKDSGRLIPGHGGLLDRLDALLVAALVAASLVALYGKGFALWR